MKEVKVLICGDFAPLTLSGKEINAEKNGCLESFKTHTSSSDFSIVNYESPIVNRDVPPISKSGPAIFSKEAAADYLLKVGFDCVTLANNHFRDYGQYGVEDTIAVCEKYGLNYVGGGKTINEARNVLYKEINNKKIAIINACENEFSIATNEYGGSNPLDLINMQEDITTARKYADYVIVILHGGIEGYHYPTPRMKRWYRHFVAIGADAVVNHHQHCVNGYEIYREKPIFYGLGNFFFPGGEKCPESWKYGYAVQLCLSEQIGFEVIPYRQDENGVVEREKDEFLIELEKYSEPIAVDDLLKIKYDKYILENEFLIKSQLLPSFLNHRILVALANRGYMGKLYSGKQLYSLKNKITCESHYEKIKRLFELLIK